MDHPITFQVNGATHQLFIDTRTTLLDALRERLGLTGPKSQVACALLAAAARPGQRARCCS